MEHIWDMKIILLHPKTFETLHTLKGSSVQLKHTYIKVLDVYDYKNYQPDKQADEFVYGDGVGDGDAYISSKRYEIMINNNN